MYHLSLHLIGIRLGGLVGRVFAPTAECPWIDHRSGQIKDRKVLERGCLV